jgi:hypothetical protein
MDPQDFIFVPSVLLVALGTHAAIVKVHSQQEARLLSWSLVLHMAGALAQVLLTRYYFPGGGDMLSYFLSGSAGADLLRSDFSRFAPEIARAFLQFPEVDPIVGSLLMGGGSSLSMGAAAMAFCFLLGNSLYAACLLVALLAYVSKVLLYRALRDVFAEEARLPALAGLTLLPSAAFWSAALLKEPLVMCFIGPAVLALHWLASGRRWLAATALLIPSALGIAVIKPYILMALALAAGVYYLWSRLAAKGPVTLKPFAVVTASLLATAGLTLGGRYFGKAEGQSVAASSAAQRRVGYGLEGGSGYQLDAPALGDDVSRRSAAQELALAPVALVTAFFRPFIFEARNAVQFVNGLEAAVLLWLFGVLVFRNRLGQVLGEVRNSPALMFATVFVFAVALGTGLTSSNLGTLSRYRAPMMPFFFMLLMVFQRGGAARRARVEPANQ